MFGPTKCTYLIYAEKDWGGSGPQSIVVGYAELIHAMSSEELCEEIIYGHRMITAHEVPPSEIAKTVSIIRGFRKAGNGTQPTWENYHCEFGNLRPQEINWHEVMNFIKQCPTIDKFADEYPEVVIKHRKNIEFLLTRANVDRICRENEAGEKITDI